MKTSTPVLLLTILLSTISCSQKGKFDCEETLNDKPYSARFHKDWDEDSIKRDSEIMMECGKLDSIDAKLFTGPFMGIILLDLYKKDMDAGNISFRRWLEIISNFKKEHKADYSFIYEGTKARLQLDNKTVDLTKFEEIRPLLIKSGMKADLEPFKAFLEKNKKNWTYKEALKAFLDSQKKKSASTEPLEFPDLVSLDDALAEAKTTNKHCLIYFSGWGCVNSRKFEQMLLTNSEVKNMIKSNFIYKVAMVDERTMASNGKETIGEKHAKLQQEKFNSAGQPSLYVVTPEGKVVAEWDYEKGIETFRDFLEKGISK